MNDENMDDYIDDLRSPIAQLMLTVMKDYNHNDSKLFRYLPFGLKNIQLDDKEQALKNLKLEDLQLLFLYGKESP